MKTDIQLKQDIEAELRWDPKVNAAHIGITVDQGVVSLLGAVDSYAEKVAVENATKRVHGVRSFAQDLTVKVLEDHDRSDSDIAGAVENALAWDVGVPKSVRAKVERSEITLEGQVDWNFQREGAERAVRYLQGVVAIHNRITLKPHASPTQVKEKVEAALHRQATTDARSIHVEISGDTVTLSGHALSWRSIRDARRAAWAAPGVTEVIDHVKMWMSN